MPKDHFIVYNDDGNILRQCVCGAGKAKKKNMKPGEYILMLKGAEKHEIDMDLKFKVDKTSKKLKKKEEG